MIYTEILEDGRTHSYSDTYKIRQIDTGIIYDDAVDTVEHFYEETDIPLEPATGDLLTWLEANAVKQ